MNSHAAGLNTFFSGIGKLMDATKTASTAATNLTTVGKNIGTAASNIHQTGKAVGQTIGALAPVAKGAQAMGQATVNTLGQLGL